MPSDSESSDIMPSDSTPSGGMAPETLREWAGERLGRAFQGLEPMAGGGSRRRYVRLRDDQGTVVGVLTDDRREMRAFLAYTRHFAARGIPVPALLAEDVARGVYVLQDLGDETLAGRLAAWRSEPDGAAAIMTALTQVVGWLARIQVQGGQGLDTSLSPDGSRQDAAAYRDDVTLFLTHYVPARAPRAVPTPAQRDALETLIGRVAALPADYFCYRDFQARNIMWVDGGPVFLDYQHGRQGPLAYDLASLLFSPDTGATPAQRERLIDAYLVALGEVGVHPAPGEFRTGFNAVVLLRRLQALGAYVRIATEKQAPEYLEKIPPALETLRELRAAGQLDFGLPALDAWLNSLFGGY